MKSSLLSRHLETDRGFYKRLIQVALPVVLQNLITTGVNMVDTIMLGQLNETALSASSLANQFIGLFTFSIMGISMGASVLCSRYWGAKQIDLLKKVITIALRFGLCLALLFTAADVFFTKPIMSLYIKDPDVIRDGVAYLRWSTPTFVLMTFSFLLSNVMRSTDMNRVPLIASICAFSINIGANYVFIFGKLGFDAMGAAGAALGTVVARVVETGVILFFFLVKNKSFRYRVRDIFMKAGDLVGEFFRTSVPVMLSDALLGVGENALAVIMGRIGKEFVSANSITSVVQRISTVFITGLAFSGCFIIGQTLGQGKKENAKKQGNTFLLLGLLTGLLAAGVILGIRAPVINSYKITDETKYIAFRLMFAVSVITLFRATNSVLTKGVIRGGGDTRFLLVADVSTKWILAIPMGLLFGLVLKPDAFWVYLALHCDEIVKAIWCVFRLRSGKWIKKVKGVEE